jgi:hypothetical protein
VRAPRRRGGRPCTSVRRRPGRAMAPSMTSAAPLACQLDAIPEADRPRYFALRAQVLAAVESVAELGDGFALQLRADRAGLVALAEWLGFERLCCPFLVFRLALEGDQPVRLELGGAEGVKDFLRAELPELDRARLVPPASLVRGRAAETAQRR